VPIGVPLDNVEFRVLDEGLHPVPEGEIGELYLCGGGVARGYHGRAALTASRFLADPQAARPGARMYRTGDRVRLLPNGQFDFHGRADRQVKVRGFRVELGEVESLLSGCPQVSSVAVVAVPGADGDKRLAAYAAVSPGADLAISQLRGYAMRTLPAHAVPATFLLLDQLPLDANGKVDRRALPDPWASRSGLHGLPPYAPPRTELERVISVAWAEALELDSVGIDDEFFTLGGDSLRSVSVLERLRAQGIQFSAGDFFGHPTVAELAALAEKSAAERSPAGKSPAGKPMAKQSLASMSLAEKPLANKSLAG
jgi:aryl carrier-like protein